MKSFQSSRHFCSTNPLITLNTFPAPLTNIKLRVSHQRTVSPPLQPSSSRLLLLFGCQPELQPPQPQQHLPGLPPFQSSLQLPAAVPTRAAGSPSASVPAASALVHCSGRGPPVGHQNLAIQQMPLQQHHGRAEEERAGGISRLSTRWCRCAEKHT